MPASCFVSAVSLLLHYTNQLVMQDLIELAFVVKNGN